MKVFQKISLGLLVFSLGLCSVSETGHAYGPSSVEDDGTAIVWPGNLPVVTIVPEKRGGCGAHSASDMLGFVQDWFAAYQNNDYSTLGVDVEDADYRDTNGNAVASDIVFSNCDRVLGVCGATQGELDALVENNQNPIVWDDEDFDSNENITVELFQAQGSDNGEQVLGFNLPIFAGTTPETLARTEEVINCALSSDELDLLATVVHEAGHTLGLDHTLANIDFSGDVNPSNNQSVPMMYPTSLTGPQQETLAPDDTTGIAYLYPSDELETETWTLKGILTDAAGDALPCVNMILRDTSDPDDNVLTFVTATEAAFQNITGGGRSANEFTPDECASTTEICGGFLFIGLDPTKTYELSASGIPSTPFDFTASFDGTSYNGSSVGRCAAPTGEDYANPDGPSDEVTFAATTFNGATVGVGRTLEVTVACNNAACATPTLDSQLLDASEGISITTLGSSADKGGNGTPTDDGDNDGDSTDSSSSAGGCQLMID